MPGSFSSWASGQEQRQIQMSEVWLLNGSLLRNDGVEEDGAICVLQAMFGVVHLLANSTTLLPCD